jgi:hypothetical protein
MKFTKPYCIALFMMLSFCFSAKTQPTEIDQCNVAWASQSKNSGESMPCGGGDIGLNVWVENDEIFCYMAKSGTFDENNGVLKLGRIRIKLSPNPFEGKTFTQELVLKDGHVKIIGTNGDLSSEVNFWVDVFRPVINVDIKSNKSVVATAAYESWRYRDRLSNGRENNANSYKWAPPMQVVTFKDSISFVGNDVLFFHRNKNTPSAFDITVHQQGLENVKNQLFNPLENLTFGGLMRGKNMRPFKVDTGKYVDTDFAAWQLQSKKASRQNQLSVYLHTEQSASLESWQNNLQKVIQEAAVNSKNAWQKTKEWWQQYWAKSYIFIQPEKPDSSAEKWQASTNYQLFRYMLGCNAFGKYPTKFNGGLFTVDPVFTDTSMHFTPDYRSWGGGTHTAQNQRLVYFPMLRSGDFEIMKPQFDFYLQMLKNAELRSKVYWGHEGACFAEQIDNFALPNYAEYGTKRPPNFDKGLEYNAWLEYEWDTVLEFCLMILETQQYADADIAIYIPMIESCLRFFDEHYQYLAKQRGAKTFDSDGKLVLFPGSAAETYKMAYNSTSTIAALKTVLQRLLMLPEAYLSATKKAHWDTMLNRIPDISFREFDGHKTISPAKLWQRINNVETPQLYPVFPWGIYGVGKPDLHIALNTYRHDIDAVKVRSHVGWKQDNIFAARLGLTSEAARLTLLKMKNSGRRFPAFWGPGYDWVPDHNWGGSGMIGMQEMLLQTDGKKILLFPAWPKDWDVHFKLYAPYNTTIEAELKAGKMTMLKVLPESRKADVEVML